ncbi:MAG: phosphoglycerate kinase [Candidatus Omnitrophica bacterium]|nr:phosphoglycerate kinase [Candidatus Omnitrophota bacterium]
MKCGGIRKIMCVVLVFTFLFGQVEMGGASENLATWTVHGKNPMRPDTLNDIAKELKRGAVGNGMPLLDLVKGKLPMEIEIDEKRRKKLVKKLRDAVNLAISLHLRNRDKIPPRHKMRAKETLSNLFSFRSHLENDLYLYDAFGTVVTPEDYLAGFSYGKKIGKDPFLVDWLNSISVLRLAQDIYHDMVPEYLTNGEDGLSEEANLDDHKIIYREIQTVIFGKDEVKALGEDYRAFIEEALFLRKEVEKIIMLAEKYVASFEMSSKRSQNSFTTLTNHSMNPIVRAIGLSAMHMKTGAGQVSSGVGDKLRAFILKKDDSPIAAAIAQSALYRKAVKMSLKLKELRQALELMAQSDIHPVAKEICGQALEGDNTVIQAVSYVRNQFLKKREPYVMMKAVELDRYAKMLERENGLSKYMGRKVPDKEKPEMSKTINELMLSVWKEINLEKPFTDQTQEQLKIMVELDRFRIAKRIPIAGRVYFGVCFARLFNEGNYQYTIDFMREVKKFSGEQASFKEHVFGSEQFLRLYLISCFMSPEILRIAEMKQFGMGQSIKAVVARVAFDELFGEKSQNVYADIFSEETTAMIEAVGKFFSGFVSFYERTEQFEKAIEFIHTMFRTSLFCKWMWIDGEVKYTGGTTTFNYAEHKKQLKEWQKNIVKKRNMSSKLIRFMKEFRGEDGNYPYFSDYEIEYRTEYRNKFKEKDRQFVTMFEEIRSFNSSTRHEALRRLMNFEEIIDLKWEGLTVLDMIYEEALSIFNVLSGMDGDANAMQKTEIENWADFLREIANHYLKRNNRARVLKITEKLESKMKTIRIADNDICPALADIQIDLGMYDEAKETILTIEDNKPGQIDLLIRLAAKQAENGKIIETKQTLSGAKVILEEYCQPKEEFKEKYKTITMGRISAVERDLKTESEHEKDSHDATYFPAEQEGKVQKNAGQVVKKSITPGVEEIDTPEEMIKLIRQAGRNISGLKIGIDLERTIRSEITVDAMGKIIPVNEDIVLRPGIIPLLESLAENNTVKIITSAQKGVADVLIGRSKKLTELIKKYKIVVVAREDIESVMTHFALFSRQKADNSTEICFVNPFDENDPMVKRINTKAEKWGEISGYEIPSYLLKIPEKFDVDLMIDDDPEREFSNVNEKDRELKAPILQRLLLPGQLIRVKPYAVNREGLAPLRESGTMQEIKKAGFGEEGEDMVISSREDAYSVEALKRIFGDIVHPLQTIWEQKLSYEETVLKDTNFPAGLRFLSHTDLGREELEGKVAYVRFGCDVPFDETKGLKDPARITDPMRIDVALPTLEHIVLNGGKVVLQPGWIKRPKGVDKNLSVIPVFLDIRKKLLDKGIIKSESEMILAPTDLETEKARSVYQNIGDVKYAVEENLKKGAKTKIVCLENPRFDKCYDEGNQDLTREIAEMVDYAVFDDYNQQHRPVSDIKFLPELIPSYVGKRLGEEIQVADQLLKKLAEPNRKPFVLLLGGKKIETKPGKVSKVTVALNLIKNELMRGGDKILIGGGVSYAFLVAEKYLERIKNDSGEIDSAKVAKISIDEIKDVIGDSYISDKPLNTDEGLKEAHTRILTFAKLLLEAEKKDIKVMLPRVHKIRNVETGEVRVGQTKIPRGCYAIDIDGESITEHRGEIKGIGIGVMAGPMGIMDDPEIPEATEGTNEILTALETETQENGAFTLSAGGETTQQAAKKGAKLSYLSVGGGMTLEVLEKQGNTHGLLALSESARKFSENALKNYAGENNENLQLDELDITCQAEFLKYNLIEWRRRHPNQVLCIAMDDDIGKEQEAQIMPLWKILDIVKNMTDAEGNPVFQESMIKTIRRSGSNGDLMRDISEFLDSNELSKENIFLVGRQTNIDENIFDSLKNVSWITGIDDSAAGREVYLPVFEALTLTIMSALGAEEASIKEYYDEISGEQISLKKLRQMIDNKLIYILPKMDRKIKDLRHLYETVRNIYIAV